MLKHVIKRDGSIALYDQSKIETAIFKAAESVGGRDFEESKRLAALVTKSLEKRFQNKIPNIEHIQDTVEKILIEEGHSRTAKAYIIYREKRRELRQYRKTILGRHVDTNLSLNSLNVLADRILLRDEEGRVAESPNEMFWRVAKTVGQRKEQSNEFYDVMVNLDFLPNSPCLMNSGTSVQQLSSCFVLPINDSIESIFDNLKLSALIHKSGGGTGFNFSKLRPRNDLITSTNRQSSGPVSFIHLFDASTEVIKHGNTGRGANIGILRIDHPDIVEFINSKDSEKLTNFNLSVGVTRKFMNAVNNNWSFDLINPRTQKVEKTVNARDIFELIAFQAWKHGDPGVLFLDRINKDNPHPGTIIEATDSCAGQPLLYNEASFLGSVNLANCVKDREIDFEKLHRIVHTGIEFLDNCIDINKYPSREIRKNCLANRKIGLGVMGFADMLYQLEIPYNSDESVKTASKIMKFVTQEARVKSKQIGKEKGPFPSIQESVYKGEEMRNSTTTTISPTGTISMIANVSSGIEPNFALSYVRRVLDKDFLFVNPYFQEIAKREGFYSDQLIQNIRNKGSVQDAREIPKKWREIFVLAHDIEPEWHIKVQAAFQKHTENAVSKTVNFPETATVNDIQQAYAMAYELGCKGITVYRDKSKKHQIMNLG